MTTDRQMVCLYYICAGLCKKGRKANQIMPITDSIDISKGKI